ncbi:MAG: hypothetical protein M3R08_06550 [Bacteroidota bacterium]|nr:hypothetical protein [Bacteroidota bacterium]
MKLKLEDNTQEAFQFLLLGAAIVLIVRAAIAGIGLWLESGSESALIEATAAYRNNFLLNNRNVIVIGGMDLFGRLSVALVLSIGAGIAGSLIAAGIARAFNRPMLPAAVLGARFGLIITLAITIYSGLFLPARSAELSDQGMRIIDRRSLPGGLSVPFSGNEELIQWKEISHLEQRSGSENTGCGVREEVLLHSDQAGRTIASEIPSGKDCDQAIAVAKRNGKILMEAITKTYL